MSVDVPRVLIVDDHAMLAESLALALRLRGFEDVSIASENLDASSVTAAVDTASPDVVLLDLFLGGAGLAIPMISSIVAQGPTVLILTASDDRVLLGRCLEAGAAGVFSKTEPFDSLVPAVIDAFMGRSTIHPATREELLAELDDHRRETGNLQAVFDRLTEREAAVLAAIVGGANADEIAEAQFIAVSTVRSHIRSILVKLGVNSQLAAVALARRASWPQPG